MSKKLKKFVYSLVGLTLVFTVFIPPILFGLLLENSLPFHSWNTIIALFSTLIIWLVIAFNLDKLDPIMKKLSKLCGVELWNEKVE